MAGDVAISHVKSDESHERTAQPPMRFDLREFSGSLGDLGTFLPLATAMAIVCRMDLSVIFIFAGLMNIASGWWFAQPLPVQPMKAIAAVAIAEGLAPGAIAAGGMVTGLLVLGLALLGTADWFARVIPEAVVRGVQAGVGLKLALKGLTMMAALPMVGWNSGVVVLVAGLVIVVMMGRRQPVLLYVFLAGFFLLWMDKPEAYHAVDGRWLVLPAFEVILPTAQEWWIGITRGALPQLPLTMLNSVVAVCALSADYFPGRGVSPKRMAASVSVMNLLCVPFGGMPMCHGSGGLAAQYHFGARTGGSVVMLGALKIGAGLLLGSVLLGTLHAYPSAILGVMVVAAGLSLAWAGRKVHSPSAVVIVVVMTAAILIASTLHGFVLGCAIAAVVALWQRWRGRVEA